MSAFIDEPYTWADASDNGYEVSSAGDVRFSAFNAKINIGPTRMGLPDVWSIECAYQVHVKGYVAEAMNSGLPKHELWRVGKGKPPKRDICPEEMLNKYVALWRMWATQNPELIAELAEKSKGKVLTDRFASSKINQAHALSIILNEQYGDS